jgi:hypothetical protein
MLHKDYDRMGSVPPAPPPKKNRSGRELQEAWCQDGLNGGKPTAVKQIWLWLVVSWELVAIMS